MTITVSAVQHKGETHCAILGSGGRPISMEVSFTVPEDGGRVLLAGWKFNLGASIPSRPLTAAGLAALGIRHGEEELVPGTVSK